VRVTDYEYCRFFGIAWIFFRRAKFWKFATPLHDPSSLIVAMITIYDVFKVVLRESGENEALQAVAAMQRGMTTKEV
jgi:hypothetical protein